jgi:hypothetical protein
MYSILATQNATLLLDHHGAAESDERSQEESTGPGRKEVRTMVFAPAPTCRSCGSILMGYDLDLELNYPVHFCTVCKAGAPTQKAEVKEAA